MTGSLASATDVVFQAIRTLWNDAAGARLSFSSPTRAFAAKLHERRTSPIEQQACFRRTGLSKTEAEELLDWLEGHGQTGQLSYSADEGFSVS